jgi:hypothetical protein
MHIELRLRKMTDQELKDEMREDMLQEARHEMDMRDDVEYCINYVMDEKLIKAVELVSESLAVIEQYHKGIEFEELREMV